MTMEEFPAPQPIVGCDVARYGADYTAYARLDGDVLTGLWRRQGKSLMETAGELKNIHMALNGKVVIVVDDTGVGGGVTDRLREQNVPVMAINFGAQPDNPEEYADTGSEIWALMARDMEQRQIKFHQRLERPMLEELQAQLLQPVYTFTSSGKLKVQKLGRDGKDPSPDLGDALALAALGRRQGMVEYAAAEIDPDGRRAEQVLRGANVLSHERKSRLWDITG